MTITTDSMAVETASSSVTAADLSLLSFVSKFMVLHTITYFLFGLLALVFLDYRSWFEDTQLAYFMRPIDDPWVAAGPLFQPLRGIIFGLALYPFRRTILNTKRGWLALWGLFVALAILSTMGPSPGSIEGLVYTSLPWYFHLYGLPEVLLQTFLLSTGFYFWAHHTEKRWFAIVLWLSFALVLTFSALGSIMGAG